MTIHHGLFQVCVWLFVIGGLLGVLMEGAWWRYRYGFWQTHTTLLWSPLCTIYSFGCVGCYVGALLFMEYNLLVRFFAFGITGTVVECAGGALVYYGLGMRAWDYSDSFLNFKGFVNLKMTFVWGLCGSLFQLLTPSVNRLLFRFNSPFWWYLSLALAAFLAVDTVFTSIVLYRWSRRHWGVPAKGRLFRFLDRRYTDEKMQKRFNNWYFVDTGSAETARTKSKA